MNSLINGAAAVTKVYRLSPDYKLYNDNYDEDGVYQGNKGSTPSSIIELSQLERLQHLKIPDTLDFNTKNPKRLKLVNIARVDLVSNVLSEELIDTIGSVGEVEWTLVPARFFDESTGEEVCISRFFGVFFHHYQDYFDYDQSDYDPRDWSSFPEDKVTDRMRKLVLNTRKSVLREPTQGFAPCFKLLASPTSGLLVSEKAQNAIVQADLKGLQIKKLKSIITV